MTTCNRPGCTRPVFHNTDRCIHHQDTGADKAVAAVAAFIGLAFIGISVGITALVVWVLILLIRGLS